MRTRYIQCPKTNKLVPAEEYRPPAQRHHAVFSDIDPYQSMQTGEMIGSRSTHREHLREHRLIEVGNEVNHMMNYRDTPQLDRERRKRDIAEVINGRGH